MRPINSAIHPVIRQQLELVDKFRSVLPEYGSHEALAVHRFEEDFRLPELASFSLNEPILSRSLLDAFRPPAPPPREGVDADGQRIWLSLDRLKHRDAYVTEMRFCMVALPSAPEGLTRATIGVSIFAEGENAVELTLDVELG